MGDNYHRVVWPWPITLLLVGQLWWLATTHPLLVVNSFPPSCFISSIRLFLLPLLLPVTPTDANGFQDDWVEKPLHPIATRHIQLCQPLSRHPKFSCPVKCLLKSYSWLRSSSHPTTLVLQWSAQVYFVLDRFHHVFASLSFELHHYWAPQLLQVSNFCLDQGLLFYPCLEVYQSQLFQQCL